MLSRTGCCGGGDRDGVGDRFRGSPKTKDVSDWMGDVETLRGSILVGVSVAPDVFGSIILPKVGRTMIGRPGDLN